MALIHCGGEILNELDLPVQKINRNYILIQRNIFTLYKRLCNVLIVAIIDGLLLIII